MHEPQRHTEGLSDSLGFGEGFPKDVTWLREEQGECLSRGTAWPRPGGGRAEQLCAGVHRALRGGVCCPCGIPCQAGVIGG